MLPPFLVNASVPSDLDIKVEGLDEENASIRMGLNKQLIYKQMMEALFFASTRGNCSSLPKMPTWSDGSSEICKIISRVRFKKI